MSKGMVVHLNRQEREQRLAHRDAQRQRAVALVVEYMPDTTDERTGSVCGWAVMAVLNLWAEHGEGKVRLGQVKAERARLLRRFNETHGPNASPRRRPIADELGEAA